MLLFNLIPIASAVHFVNFNTSNVTIQLILSYAVNVVVAISIHLMLLFNYNKVIFIKGVDYFNTSNVTIQPIHNNHQQAFQRFQYI